MLLTYSKVCDIEKKMLFEAYAKGEDYIQLAFRGYKRVFIV